MTDIFTTLVDLRWKYNMIIFVFVYTAAWSMFGFLWWMVAFVRLVSYRGSVSLEISNLHFAFRSKPIYANVLNGLASYEY